nr:FGGY-family carbohydrate kinase [Flavobacterium limnophilum]
MYWEGRCYCFLRFHHRMAEKRTATLWRKPENGSDGTSVQDNNGVYVVPAFSGLGAPYWNRSRKASIKELTFDSKKIML